MTSLTVADFFDAPEPPHFDRESGDPIRIEEEILEVSQLPQKPERG